MLTGRRDGFSELRKSGGLSGFPKISESEHDAFGTGHSSTSVSAALGFAIADKQNGSDARTVAVIGDGAFTGGMVHEALNNCKTNIRLTIILNENEMSISKNTGRFAKSIARLRAKKFYIKTKARTRDALKKIPVVGDSLFETAKSFKKTVKDVLYKYRECKNVYGVDGIFAWEWYESILQLKNFSLGRLQFEVKEFRLDAYEKDGKTVKKGDIVLSVHIPSTGEPLSKALCEDSYAKARAFFRNRLGFLPPFVCWSWLLYGKNKEFLMLAKVEDGVMSTVKSFFSVE
jgi:hypothetical protein